MVIRVKLWHLLFVLETLAVLLMIAYVAAVISLFFHLPPPSLWWRR